MVLISDHVDVLYAIKIWFPPTDFFAVQVHLLMSCVPLFIQLVDDEGRVVVDIKAPDSQFDGQSDAMQACFVLGDVIGCWKKDPKDVVKFVLVW